MKATMSLRFVTREVPAVGEQIASTYNVLQQYWEAKDGDERYGEWRDVPLESEAPASSED